MDREKVVKGLECIYGYLNDKESKSVDCPYNDTPNVRYCIDCLNYVVHDAFKLIKAMERDLKLVSSCKVCKNWEECSPDAPPDSPKFKKWRDCWDSCKSNWEWQGE